MSFRNVDPRLLRERYARAPQLREYDQLEPHVHPYVGLASGRGIRTARVSTDAHGFRRTPAGTGMVDTLTPVSELDGVVLGGSFTFGVGSSGDGTTLVAHLAEVRAERWLNLGIRAGNSTQELTAALPFVPGVPRVVVCSGANNLVAALQTDGRHEVYGPMFFEAAVDTVAQVAVHDLVEFVSSGARPRRRGWRPRRPDPANAAPDPTTGAPAATVLTLAERLRRAVDRQLRDLTALARLAGDPDRILFCAQPFADSIDRAHVPEERPVFALHDQRQGERWAQVRGFALARWPEYVDALRRGCAALGVRVIDLPAAGFDGWSFVDRLHLTDHGYRQAGQLIAEALL